MSGIDDLFLRVYDELDHPKRIASFAKPVAEAAANGDDVAIGIVDRAAEELAIAAETAAESASVDPPIHVGCVGSFGSSAVVSERLESKIRDRIPNVKFVDPIRHPAVGGVAFAAEHLGTSLDRERLRVLDERVDERMA
jgi:N-acetylglucosamine kinase-like BadF-type ATPase